MFVYRTYRTDWALLAKVRINVHLCHVTISGTDRKNPQIQNLIGRTRGRVIPLPPVVEGVWNPGLRYRFWKFFAESGSGWYSGFIKVNNMYGTITVPSYKVKNLCNFSFFSDLKNPHKIYEEIWVTWTICTGTYSLTYRKDPDLL